jgi:hypothetical protein
VQITVGDERSYATAVWDSWVPPFGSWEAVKGGGRHRVEALVLQLHGTSERADRMVRHVHVPISVLTYAEA